MIDKLAAQTASVPEPWWRAGAFALALLGLVACERNGDSESDSTPPKPGDGNTADQNVSSGDQPEVAAEKSDRNLLPELPVPASADEILEAINDNWYGRNAQPGEFRDHARYLRVKFPLPTRWQNVAATADAGAAENPSDFRWHYLQFIAQLPPQWNPEFDDRVVELLSLYGWVDPSSDSDESFADPVPWSVPSMPQRLDMAIRQLLTGGLSKGYYSFANQRHGGISSPAIPTIPSTLLHRDVAIHLVMQQMGYPERKAAPIVRRVCAARNDASFVVAGMAAQTISFSWAADQFPDDPLIAAFAVLDTFPEELELSWIARSADLFAAEHPALAVIAGLRAGEFGADGDALFSEALDRAAGMDQKDLSWLAYQWRAAQMLEFRRDGRSDELLARLESLFGLLEAESRSTYGGDLDFRELPLSERIRTVCRNLHQTHEAGPTPLSLKERPTPGDDPRDTMFLKYQANRNDLAGPWLNYRRGRILSNRGETDLNRKFIENHCVDISDATVLGHWAGIARQNGHGDLGRELVQRARETDPDSLFLLQRELVIGKTISAGMPEVDRWPLDWLSDGLMKIDRVDEILGTSKAISQHLHNLKIDRPSGWEQMVVEAVHRTADLPENRPAVREWVKKNRGRLPRYGKAIAAAPKLAALHLFADDESYLYESIDKGPPFRVSRGSLLDVIRVVLLEDSAGAGAPLFSQGWYTPTGLEFAALTDWSEEALTELEKRLEQGGLSVDRTSAFGMLRGVMLAEIDPDECWRWYSENRDKRNCGTALLRAFADEKYLDVMGKIIEDEIQRSESWDLPLQRLIAWYLKKATDMKGFAAATDLTKKLSLALSSRFSTQQKRVLEDLAKQPRAFFLSLQAARDSGIDLFADVHLELISSSPRDGRFIWFCEDSSYWEHSWRGAHLQLADAMGKSQDDRIRFFPMTSHDGRNWCALGLLSKNYQSPLTEEVGGVVAVEPSGFDEAFAKEFESWDLTKKREFVIYADTRHGPEAWRSQAPKMAALAAEE